MYTNRDRYSAGSLLRTTVMAANSTPALELEEQWPANRDVITVFRQPVIEVGKLGPLPPAETDCVAGHAGLELRNVVANYPFERSHRFAGIQPKLATETIRV